MWRNTLRTSGKFIASVWRMKWIDKSPFTAYKGKTKNVDHFYLNKEELAHIAEKSFYRRD